MAKRRTSNYRPVNAGKPAGKTRRMRLHRPGRRREIAILVGLGGAAIVAVAALAGAFLMTKADHDWASVATVNGHSINRETLRARMNVLVLLAQERSAFDAEKVAGEFITAEQLPGVRAEALGMLADPIGSARESLIDDELVRQLASREGVATPAPPDAWAEALTYATGDLAHRARVVRFGLPAGGTGSEGAGPGGGANPWPAANSANVAAATDRLGIELAANTAVEAIVAGLRDAGWTVYGQDVAISADGAPADASLQLDPIVAAGVMNGHVGDVVGPGTDEYGRVTMARLLQPADRTAVRNRLTADAEKAKLDAAALQDWANGQALRRALAAELLARWKSKGVSLAHFRELVIGDVPTSASAGPWVELSGLALDRLAPLNPSAVAGAPAGLDLNAAALVKTLQGLPLDKRSALFRSLVAAANAAPTNEPNKISGEVGFATKGGLVAEVGKAAFDSKVRTGDVLGPISTSTGPQLFLVEARYPGALDDRAQAALRIVRADPAPDLPAYTTRFSPADAALARDAGWRADAEFGSDEAVRGALFDTPIGLLSDPFALDGKLALAIVDQRHTGLPDARAVARLSLDGYAAWFHDELAKATITRSDNPLPELAPTASPTVALPTMPGLETPALPTIPGLPAATPVKTDELGLPVLP